MTGPFLKGLYARAIMEGQNAKNVLAENPIGSFTPEQLTELNEIIEQGEKRKQWCIDNGFPECIPKRCRDN